MGNERSINSSAKDVYRRPPAYAFWLLLICAWFLNAHAARADAIDWPTLGFTPVGTNGFQMPVVITHAGDGSGRLFIVEQWGRIQILQGTNELPMPFLDISSRVATEGSEQGLLGLAFPPGFPTNQHFYVDYTRPDNAVVISRFNVSSTNANLANGNSEQVLLVIPKPYNYHNGGQLAFGPDGYLYIGVGDGGPEGDTLNSAQNTGLLLGKLLRIDVENGATPYRAPTNNPFVGNANYAPEIWALGLRNPWRFSFDRLTGDLYIGDVGQNNFEEINFQPAGLVGGQNYGWRIMEGPTNYIVPAGFTNFASLTVPVVSYSHASLPTDFSAAVIGGYIYRGPEAPRLNGIYFYGDYVAGWIWGMKQSGSNWQSVPLFSPSSPSYNISTFGEDDSGQIYMADYTHGKIYQLQDSGQAWPPTFQASNNIVNAPFVTVSCLTTGAVIHYTSNGIDPTESDPAVAAGGSIPVTFRTVYKIRAYRVDLTPSQVASGSFTGQTGTPVFVPAAGPITNKTPVSITTVTPNATIYYTTNGTTPTTNSRVYTNPVILSGGNILEAMDIAAGYANGLVGTAVYTTALVTTPTFSPSGGAITNKTWVSISNATPGAVIHYTTNGKDPTSSSTTYSKALQLSGGATLKAIGIAKGYSNSVVASLTYTTAQTAKPIFNPAGGPIVNGTTIQIACATPGSAVYYTTNGSYPTTKSQIYFLPMKINGGIVFGAIAAANGYSNSDLQTAFYTISQSVSPQGAYLMVQTGGHVQIRWQTAMNNTYTIRYSDDLLTWTMLGDPVVGDGSILTVTDPTSIQQAPHRYYRVDLVQ